MSFEIRPTEEFWSAFRERLPASAQESVLDLLETLREHPGDLINRELQLPHRTVMTRPITVETDQGSLRVCISFQYDADESSIHLNDLIILPNRF